MGQQHKTEELSYHDQFQQLKGCKDLKILRSAYPGANEEAQSKVPGAFRIPLTNIYTKAEDRPLLAAETTTIPWRAAQVKNFVTCCMRFIAISSMHTIAAVFAYKTFSWQYASYAMAIYTIHGIFGITLCYHRMLTHRSFKCSKPFEYLCAFIACQAGQGDPIEWVSTHRYHHLHCDTPLDPHSPYEGWWWSHILWLFKTEASYLDYGNASDLKKEFYYRFLEIAFFPLLFIIKPLVTYYYGGMALVCWTIAVPMVFGWHSTFLVNSAAHTWGDRTYDTGDLSTDCWWVAVISFGEGWHNAHHAFPYSARHGLEWYQWDPTWYLICTLEFLGIVWDVELPSEKVKASKKLKKDQKVAAAAAAVAATAAAAGGKKGKGLVVRAKKA